MSKRAIYASNGAVETEEFFDSLHGEATKGAASGVLDSANIKETTKDAVKGDLPASVQKAIECMPEDQKHRVLDSVLVGMQVYRREHGVMPTADVIEAALQQGVSAGRGIDKRGNILDSVGDTSHHDQISSQPNRIVVAITSAIAEAFPAATYLPVDIGSNEARLGIISHLSGSAFGGYEQNELMDGINIGKEFLSAERRVPITLNGTRETGAGQVTTTTGGATGLKVLRGRTLVLVNGFPVAAESPSVSSGVANSPISGVATIAGADYAITGYITVANGTISLGFSPALPVNTVVEAEGFIDYEAAPELSPELLTQVTNYALYATPWRARARQTIDSKTQYSNELGMDLQSESLIAIRNQFAMERHYNSLNKLMALAKNNTATFDFAFSTRNIQLVRSQIWQDLQAVLGAVDQQMAIDTMDHGITHLYVGKNVAAQWLGLPKDIFAPSGLQARPGIFRLGTLFGRYEVYYTPKVVVEGSTTSQILCIGRSTQVARCPLVLGDAVAATYLPLSFGDDMKFGQAFYARNFTSVNPHAPSAKGAALINITNLF